MQPAPVHTDPGLGHSPDSSPDCSSGRRPGAGGWTLPWKTRGARHHIRPAIARIERRWIADLADLADKSSGPEANDAYRRLFNLAIARDLCIDAQPAAQSCLASIPFGEPEPAARPAWRRSPGTGPPRPGHIGPGLRPGREGGVRTVARRPEGTLQETGLRAAGCREVGRRDSIRRGRGLLPAPHPQTAATTSPASCASWPVRTTPRPL